MAAEFLRAAAQSFGTPLYVYDAQAIRRRFDLLKSLFAGRFGISYAVKANPNLGLLRAIRDKVVTYDASAFGEVERALATGIGAERITFSGPAKRREEIERAVEIGVGELVLESLADARVAAEAARRLGRVQSVLVRINPAAAPRAFGVNMSGKPSQFGVDEEEMEPVLAAIKAMPGLALIGFHVYSGTNSLNPQAIADNFAIFAAIFRNAAKIVGTRPRKLIFGSGFGLPYLPEDAPLDVAEVARLVIPIVDELRAEPIFSDAELALEMGRWLVGPEGWLLSSVVAEKHSRGTDFRIFDAGFNNQLAACGMMGSVIRRNWRISNISRPDAPDATYTLTGPLCTTIDVIATKITLPRLDLGDVIAIENSGAYGLTASPTRFISHPEPREVLWDGSAFQDVTESSLNHWSARTGAGVKELLPEGN